MGGPDVSSVAFSKPTWRRLILAGGYVILPLVLYPALLIAAQDFPNLPRLSLDRYFAPGELSTYTWIVAASAFIVVYIWGFTQFAKDGRRLFLTAAIILCLVLHFGVAYIVAGFFGVASPARLPLSTQNLGMFFSIVLAAHIAEPLIFYCSGRKAFGIRSAGIGGLIGLIVMFFVFASMFLYPFAMLLIDAFPDFSQIYLSRISEPSRASLFSYQTQLVALGSVVLVWAVVTLLYITTKKVHFFFAAGTLSYVLYNLGMLIISHVDRALGATHLQPNVCRSSDVSECLLFWEHGAMFALAVAAALVIVERAFKHFGEPKVYRL